MKQETKKQREARINNLIQRTINGWTIPMMKLSLISAAGHMAADNGQDIEAAVLKVLSEVAKRSF